MRTYVRVDGSPRFVVGKFAPQSKYQEFLVIDPISGSSTTLAALHIEPLSASEAADFEVKVAPVLKARADELARVRAENGTLPREARCYVCGTLLNASRHSSCETCHWIVCPSCGACGCGYSG